MRGKVMMLATLFLFSVLAVVGAEKKEKFEVKATETCETHIEKAAKEVDGVSSADWDEETQNLEVVFDDAKTTVAQIEKAVANSGHDTPNYKAEQKCGSDTEKDDQKPKTDEE